MLKTVNHSEHGDAMPYSMTQSEIEMIRLVETRFIESRGVDGERYYIWFDRHDVARCLGNFQDFVAQATSTRNAGVGENGELKVLFELAGDGTVSIFCDVSEDRHFAYPFSSDAVFGNIDELSTSEVEERLLNYVCDAWSHLSYVAFRHEEGLTVEEKPSQSSLMN